MTLCSLIKFSTRFCGRWRWLHVRVLFRFLGIEDFSESVNRGFYFSFLFIEETFRDENLDVSRPPITSKAIPLGVRALICKASPQTTILGRSHKKTWKSIYFISLEKKHGNNKFLVLLERITTTRTKNVWLRILIFVPVAHKKIEKNEEASEVYLKWLLKDAARWSCWGLWVTSVTFCFLEKS